MSSSSSKSASSQVVALPSMTHGLVHLPTMPAVDPRCLRYGGLGASKEASQAKLQQTLQRSAYAASSSGTRAPPPGPAPPCKDDGDYLMMKQGRKKSS